MATQTDLERIRQEQREHWNNSAIGWQKNWSAREKSNQPVADRLIQLAHIKPGDRVLDIATGLGEPAVTAARAVGPSGLVVATDQAAGMIAGARSRAKELGMSNMEFIETHAEELAVGERKFNAVVCRMGLMFVPDLEAAARRIAQVLEPGGYLATAVWSTPEKVPMISVGDNAVRTALNLPPREPDAPHPLRLGNPQPLLDTLAKAGFKDIKVESIMVNSQFPNPAAYGEQQRTSGPLRAVLNAQPPEKLAALLRAVTEAARPYADATGTVRMVSETLLISAHL